MRRPCPHKWETDLSHQRDHSLVFNARELIKSFHIEQRFSHSALCPSISPVNSIPPNAMPFSASRYHRPRQSLPPTGQGGQKRDGAFARDVLWNHTAQPPRKTSQCLSSFLLPRLAELSETRHIPHQWRLFHSSKVLFSLAAILLSFSAPHFSTARPPRLAPQSRTANVPPFYASPHGFGIFPKFFQHLQTSPSTLLVS